MIRLIIIFSLLLKLSECIITDLVRTTKSIIEEYPDGPERDKMIAKESMLVRCRNDQKDPSIFSQNIDILCKRTGRSKSDQYTRLLNGLAEYLNDYCFESLRKFKQNKMTPFETMKFIEPFAELHSETFDFESYGVKDYDIPEKTLTTFFRSLQVMNLNGGENFRISNELAFFCKTQGCIVPFFTLAKEHLTNYCQSEIFSKGFKINPKLQALVEFDQFVKDLMTPPLRNYVRETSILFTILSGPITDFTNEAMLNLFSDDAIRLIAVNAFYQQRLAYRAAKSNLYEQVLARIHPIDEYAIKLRIILKSYRADYETVVTLSDIDFRTLDPDQTFAIKANALDNYYRVDRELVTDCVLKMNEGVFVLLDRAMNANSAEMSNELLQGSLTVLSFMPTTVIPELKPTNFEIILDFILRPSSRPYLTTNDIRAIGFMNILRLYHSEITPTLLQKYWIIYRCYLDEATAVESIIKVLVMALSARSDNCSIEFTKMIHQFCDQNEIDFSIIALYQLLTVKGSNLPFAENFLNYCETHKLVPKTPMDITKKRLMATKKFK